MGDERVVCVHTSDKCKGSGLSNSVIVSIDGVEIPGIISVDIKKLERDSFVKATIEVLVRLGK